MTLTIDPTDGPADIRQKYEALAPQDQRRRAYQEGLHADITAWCPYDGRTREGRAWRHGRLVAEAER